MMTQSAVIHNGMGGLELSNGDFVIVGNVFAKNGGTGSTVGGISVSASSAVGNRIEFNSFSGNRNPTNVEKTTNTDAVKHVPVHPVLAAILAE